MIVIRGLTHVLKSQKALFPKMTKHFYYKRRICKFFVCRLCEISKWAN